MLSALLPKRPHSLIYLLGFFFFSPHSLAVTLEDLNSIYKLKTPPLKIHCRGLLRTRVGKISSYPDDSFFLSGQKRIETIDAQDPESQAWRNAIEWVPKILRTRIGLCAQSGLGINCLHTALRWHGLAQSWSLNHTVSESEFFAFTQSPTQFRVLRQTEDLALGDLLVIMEASETSSSPIHAMILFGVEEGQIIIFHKPNSRNTDPMGFEYLNDAVGQYFLEENNAHSFFSAYRRRNTPR